MTRKEEILFNDGAWFAIQTIVVDFDEPTIAQHNVKELHLDKEMRRCQKKSEYLNEIMRKFINSCD